MCTVVIISFQLNILFAFPYRFPRYYVKLHAPGIEQLVSVVALSNKFKVPIRYTKSKSIALEFF